MNIVVATAILVVLSLPAYAANDVIVSGDHELVKDSDDFGVYKDAFAKAASKLIASGKCSAGDFREFGGWLKSSNHLNKRKRWTNTVLRW